MCQIFFIMILKSLTNATTNSLSRLAKRKDSEQNGLFDGGEYFIMQPLTYRRSISYIYSRVQHKFSILTPLITNQYRQEVETLVKSSIFLYLCPSPENMDHAGAPYFFFIFTNQNLKRNPTLCERSEFKKKDFRFLVQNSLWEMVKCKIDLQSLLDG